MNPKPIERARNPLLALALPALIRARKRAERIAFMTGSDLVQMVDGKIVRVRPSELEAEPSQEVTTAALPSVSALAAFASEPTKSAALLRLTALRTSEWSAR